MTALTHTSRHVHVPITWIVLLAVVLTVVALASTSVNGWDRVMTPTAPGSEVQPAPAPVPGPMALQPVLGRTLIGQPYPSRAGADGWLV